MKLQKQSILSVSVTTSRREAIVSALSRFLSVKRPVSPSFLQIVTPNPEQIVLAQKDEVFCRILNGADIALPDGAGVVWAVNRFNYSSVIPAKAGIHNESLSDQGIPRQARDDKTIERISGVDFMVDLCRLAAEKKKRVLFYGGRAGTAQIALNALKKSIPALDGIAEDGAEIADRSTKYEVRGTNEEDVIKHLVQVIRSRNIGIVCIGLGAPKQEYLMDALRNRLSFPSRLPLSLRAERSNLYDKDRHAPQSGTRDDTNVVLMVVGGAFDMLAGKISRAPKVVQRLGFEWLWRLFQEPWRWKRQLVLLEFLRLAVTQK